MLRTDERTGIAVRPCKYCKTGYPVVFTLEGNLCYARCNNPQCHKWDRYEFCAGNIANALNSWNEGNSRPAISTKRKKDE